MAVIKIVTTVFDALIIFFIGCAISGMEDKKSLRISVMMIVVLIMNLFVMWG